jgi:hypothetical protein
MVYILKNRWSKSALQIWRFTENYFHSAVLRISSAHNKGDPQNADFATPAIRRYHGWRRAKKFENLNSLDRRK